MSIPTTDEMDSTTPEDRLKLVIQCAGCGGWIWYTGKEGKMMQSQAAPPCPTCGDTKHVPRSLISQRTFDPVKGKKETAAWLRKKKK